MAINRPRNLTKISEDKANNFGILQFRDEEFKQERSQC